MPWHLEGLPVEPPANHNRFIILGCHRTGTTLMRLITDSHPSVHCLDETTSYGAYSGKQQAQLKPNVTKVGYKMPNWTELFLEYDEIASYYKGEPIIFMLRNVYDTIVSMQTLKTGENRHFVNGVLQSLAAWKPDKNRRKFQERYAADLRVVEKCSCPQAAAAAIFWKYKTESFFEMVKANFNIMPVQYETLTKSPRPQIERIASFLGLEFHIDMMRHASVDHTEVNEDGRTIGRTNAKRPIHAQSVDRWPSYLTVEEYRVIKSIAGDLNKKIKSRLYR